MIKPAILLIVTSADHIGNPPHPTGYWLEEVVAPYYVFADAGYPVTIASVKGGNAPCAKESLAEDAATSDTRRYHTDAELQDLLQDTKRLGDVNVNDYAGFFFAGGHGTMVDFPSNPDVIQTVEHAVATNKPLASVCHGPACLVGANAPNGEPVIAQKRFTCFSDAEETHIQQQNLVPFMLEETLAKQGGTPQNARLFEANTVIDGNLITGQNPASSAGTANALVQQL